jgi:hypothetical protein
MTCAYDISRLLPPSASRNKGRSRAREKNEPYEVNCLLCGFNANGASRRTVRISEEHAKDLGWVLLPEVQADGRTQRFETWVCAECSDDVLLVATRSQVAERSQVTLLKVLDLVVQDKAATRHADIAAWISGGMPQEGALVQNVERSSNAYHQKLKQFYEEAFGLNWSDR